MAQAGKYSCVCLTCLQDRGLIHCLSLEYEDAFARAEGRQKSVCYVRNHRKCLWNFDPVGAQLTESLVDLCSVACSLLP